MEESAWLVLVLVGVLPFTLQSNMGEYMELTKLLLYQSIAIGLTDLTMRLVTKACSCHVLTYAVLHAVLHAFNVSTSYLSAQHTILPCCDSMHCNVTAHVVFSMRAHLKLYNFMDI